MTEDIHQIADHHADDLGDHVANTLLVRLQLAHRRLRALSSHEAKMVQKLRQQLIIGQQMWRVPRLHGEVHDLFALQRAGEMLFSQD